MQKRKTNLANYLKGRKLVEKLESSKKGQTVNNISADIGKVLQTNKSNNINNELNENSDNIPDTKNYNTNIIEHTDNEETLKNLQSELDVHDNVTEDTSDGDTEEGYSYDEGHVGEDVDLLKLNEKELDQIVRDKYNKLSGINKPDFTPFAFAYLGYLRVRDTTDYIKNTKYLTVVDFTKSSGSNRFYVINLETNTIENCIPVGHGHGKNYEVGSNPTSDSFSNEEGSEKSSLGSFITSDDLQSNTRGTWQGLLMRGVEESNYHATSRGIYIHPGPVTRSEGCFTLWKGKIKGDEEITTEEIEENKNLTKPIIEKLKGGSFVFSYYDSLDYLYDSWILNPTIGNILHDKGMIIGHDIKTKLKNLASYIKKLMKK